MFTLYPFSVGCFRLYTHYTTVSTYCQDLISFTIDNLFSQHSHRRALRGITNTHTRKWGICQPLLVSQYWTEVFLDSLDLGTELWLFFRHGISIRVNHSSYIYYYTERAYTCQDNNALYLRKFSSSLCAALISLCMSLTRCLAASSLLSYFLRLGLR